VKTEAWPIYYRDELEVGDRQSCVAVCTLWTPRKPVAQALDRESFSVVGSLYSRDGINAIIRNVLAHPVIRHIVLCGREMTDSGDALVALIEKGVDTEWRVVGNGAQIDCEVPVAAIDDFRRATNLHDHRGTTSPAKMAQVVAALGSLPPFGQPRTFPETKRDSDTFPAERAGFVVRGRDVPEVWVQLLSHIMTFGRVTPTDYGQRQKELVDVMAVIEGGDSPSAELPAWMPVSSAEGKEYAELFMSPQEQPGVAYSYGQRLRAYWGVDQITVMAEDLKRFRFSRRSVASVWDPRLDSGSEDPPCIDLVQALVRDGKLHLTAYIRSNDIYRAWPQNAIALRHLQTVLAEEVQQTGVGDLITLSQSAHVYEDCWERVLELLDGEAKGLISGARFRQDPRGSFVIRVEDGEIIVDHYSPEGDRLRTLRSGSARDLERLLSPFVSLPEHGMYVGRELGRAERALRMGERYEQEAMHRAFDSSGQEN